MARGQESNVPSWAGARVLSSAGVGGPEHGACSQLHPSVGANLQQLDSLVLAYRVCVVAVPRRVALLRMDCGGTNQANVYKAFWIPLALQGLLSDGKGAVAP